MGGIGSGRKPRPNHLKALEGVRESRLNRDEPIPGEQAVVPPVELPEDALAVWRRLAPDLIAKRVMTAWDVDLFGAFCCEVALYHRAWAEVEANGTNIDRPRSGPVVSPAFRVAQSCLDAARSLAASYGLTPADRARLKIEPNSSDLNSLAARFIR